MEKFHCSVVIGYKFSWVFDKNLALLWITNINISPRRLWVAGWIARAHGSQQITCVTLDAVIVLPFHSNGLCIKNVGDYFWASPNKLNLARCKTLQEESLLKVLWWKKWNSALEARSTSVLFCRCSSVNKKKKKTSNFIFGKNSIS